MVVLWAYPHRQEELSTYGQYILGQFLAGVNIHLNIKFDQAAHKFFHGHQELYFANISKLGFLPTRSSCHMNSKGAAVLTLLPQAPPKVLDIEKTKGSGQVVPLNSPSAVNSTSQQAVSDWTVSSLTSVPIVPQAATLSPTVCEK